MMHRNGVDNLDTVTALTSIYVGIHPFEKFEMNMRDVESNLHLHWVT